MRIFTGFLIMLCSVVLWFLPISEAIYAWQTDARTETHQVITAAGVVADNVVLVKQLYGNDTGTISFLSTDADDSPTLSSYNGTTRAVEISGLAASTTRDIEVTYDVSAFASTPTLDTIGDIALWLTYVLYVIFPMAGLVYIFWEKWFG